MHLPKSIELARMSRTGRTECKAGRDECLGAERGKKALPLASRRLASLPFLLASGAKEEKAPQPIRRRKASTKHGQAQTQAQRG
jgi:hypothetical protein